MKTLKTAPRRWHALALAALVAAGTLAIPLAADAATSKSTDCQRLTTTCSISVKVSKQGANSTRLLTLTESGNRNRGLTYSVRDTTRGVTLCSGKFSSHGSTVGCRIPNRSAAIKVTAQKRLDGAALSVRVH